MASQVGDQRGLTQSLASMTIKDKEGESLRFGRYSADMLLPKNSPVMVQYHYQKQHEDKLRNPLRNFLSEYQISKPSVIYRLGVEQPVESKTILGSQEKLDTSFIAPGRFSLIAFCSMPPTDHSSEDAIAIKIPWDQSGRRGKGVNDDIDWERTILSELDHPNVASLYGFIETEDNWSVPVNIMPRYHQSLRMLLNQPRISPASGDSLSLDLLSGIAYIHEKNFCHRDIKVSNCLVSKNGVLKIGDFGLARPTDSSGFCRSTGFAGSCGYMAPEIRHDGRRVFGRWSDMFAASITLCDIMGFKTGGLYVGGSRPGRWNSPAKFLNDTEWGGTLSTKWQKAKEEKELDERDFLSQSGFPRQLKSPDATVRCPDTERVMLLASYLRENYRGRPTAKEGYQFLSGWKRRELCREIHSDSMVGGGR